MDSIAAGELPQADGISWKYKNSIEFPKTDHELSGHGTLAADFHRIRKFWKLVKISRRTVGPVTRH